MHYAANYNCSLIPSLLLKSDKSGSKDPIEVCKKVLEELTSRVCSEIEKEEASMPEIMNIYQGKKISEKETSNYLSNLFPIKR